MIVVTVAVYVKLKIDIALFLRETLGCYRNTSGGSHVFGQITFVLKGTYFPQNWMVKSSQPCRLYLHRFVTAVTKQLFVLVCLDGKRYDAFLMCYKSDTDTGLNEDDRKCLESVLEERFGYSLCFCDRDILPGNGMVLYSL